MKKIALIMMSLLGLALLFGGNQADASGCFHDALNKDAHYEKIVSGVRVRNVACMYGSDVITTIPGGTIVRVIAYNQYWKQIELADGKAGWIGADFAARTSTTANIPCSGVTPGDYCDTSNLARCPNPSPQGVVPTWYRRTAPVYNCSTQTVTTPVQTTTTTTTSYVAPTSTAIQLTDAFKLKLDDMVLTVSQKIDAKYGSDDSGKLTHYNNLVAALKIVKKSAPKLENLIDYLVSKFEEKAALMELSQILNIE